SAHLMIRHTGIPEELDLASHGLRYVDCDPWGFAPAPPGSDEPPLVFHRDLDATCASISEACGRGDADAYREFVARWDVLAGRMMKGFAARPTAARLGGAFLGPQDLRDPFGAVQTVLSSRSGDEPPLVCHRDLDATCASSSEACGRGDADAYREFVARWDVLAGRMMKGFAARPTAARLGGAFLGPQDLRDPFGAVQTFLSSGDALLDSTFSSERLKAALSWFGAQSGPPMSHPATAPMIGFAALMHRVPPGRAIG